MIEIEFAGATTALWSENAGAHPGATLSTNFEIQRPSSGLPGRPRLCAGGVLQPRAPLRKVPGVQLPHHAAVQRPNGVAEHNVTVARAFTKLMGAFVTFWDNDAGPQVQHDGTIRPRASPGAAVRGLRDLLSLSRPTCHSFFTGPVFFCSAAHSPLARKGRGE